MDKWIYKGKPIDKLPEGVEAFVYIIEFDEGSKYIGYKNRYSIRRTKVKDKLRKKVTKTEKWQDYTSSSSEVKKLIDQGILYKKTITHLCSTKGVATMLEVFEMIKHNVLCDTSYLNRNILGRYFKCPKLIKGIWKWK